MNPGGTIDFNSLTTALTTIVKTIESGNDAAAGALASITEALGIIELVLWGAWILYGHEALGNAVKKFLGLQFWLWFIRGFHELSKIFMKSLVAGAFSVAGAAGSIKDLMDPSSIAGQGLEATLPLALHMDAVSDWDFSTRMLIGLVLILVMLCFILMAVNIAWAVIEFYMFLNLSSLLIPFALLPATRFLADKGINAVVASSLKLATYAFVVAIIAPILDGIELQQAADGAGLGWNDMFAIMMIAIFCLGLCLRAPNIAAGLIHGSPTLSGTSAVMALAAGTAMGVNAAGGALLGALGTAVGQAGDGARWLWNNRGRGGGGDENAPKSDMAAAASAGVMNSNPIYAYGVVQPSAGSYLAPPQPHALPANIVEAQAELVSSTESPREDKVNS